MAGLSLLQLSTITVMGAFLLVSAWRMVTALDLIRALARGVRLARWLLRARNSRDPERQSDAIRRVQATLGKRPAGPLSALLDDIEHLAPADRVEPALSRFRDRLERRVMPAMHGLAQMARIAGPLGLGFTTLILSVSLTNLDPGAAQGPASLLAALPLSLVTTMIACFTVVPLRLAESRLIRLAEELDTTVSEIFETELPQ